LRYYAILKKKCTDWRERTILNNNYKKHHHGETNGMEKDVGGLAKGELNCLA
jgi:hypothetical protein